MERHRRRQEESCHHACDGAGRATDGRATPQVRWFLAVRAQKEAAPAPERVSEGGLDSVEQDQEEADKKLDELGRRILQEGVHVNAQQEHLATPRKKQRQVDIVDITPTKMGTDSCGMQKRPAAANEKELTPTQMEGKCARRRHRCLRPPSQDTSRASSRCATSPH